MKQEAIGNFMQSLPFFIYFSVLTLIGLKNCLDLYFHTLIINLFFDQGSEPMQRNTVRLLAVCLGEGILVVVLCDR